VSADELSPDPPVADEDALHVLTNAAIEIQGRMPWSSNATFLVDLCVDGEISAQAIYKPERGERPLWDFPSGLYQREVAAYRLWVATGWTVLVGGGVPPTIVRHDAPYDTGSLQLFIPSDFEQHYFTILEQREDLHLALQAMCAFDLLANNTDRKGGHCLLGLDGNVWGIDHGLCFAAEFKLRTVIWDFAGQNVPVELRPAIEGLAHEVPRDVAELLDDDEVDALSARAARLVATGRFPTDPSGRRYPWPMV
jgi:uncharacterized repeat protein (TIGR03843 family)